MSWWKIVGMGKNSRYPSAYSTKWFESRREVLVLGPLALCGKEPGDLPRQLRLVRSPGRLSLLFFRSVAMLTPFY